MVKGSQAIKSGLIQVLMAKANEQLGRTENRNNRTKIISATVHAMRPILREYTRALDDAIERIKIRIACASVGRK